MWGRFLGKFPDLPYTGCWLAGAPSCLGPVPAHCRAGYGEGWFLGALGPQHPGCTMMQSQRDSADRTGNCCSCFPRFRLLLGFEFPAAVSVKNHVWTVSFLQQPGKNAALMLPCSHIKLHVSERWLLFSLFPDLDLGFRFYTSRYSPQGFPVAATALPVRIKWAHSLEGVAFCQSIREVEYADASFSL